MGNRWTAFLVGVLAGACGERNTGNGFTSPPPSAAGMTSAGMDAGQQPDAAPSRVEPVGGTGGQVPAAGFGGNGTGGTGGIVTAAGTPAAGSYAPVAGQAGAAQGGSGGTPTGGSGGQAAPTEHVLWSQRFTGMLEPGQVGFPNATMGLGLDAGDLCLFGFSGSASGSAQTFPTDGACITAFSGRQAVGVVYDSAGVKSGGTVARAALTGWTEAVTGHRVTYLRRTQTYSLQYLGGDNKTNFGTFDGTWEAWGY